MHTMTNTQLGTLYVLMKKVMHTSPHSANSTHSRELLNIYNYNKTTATQFSTMSRFSKAA